MKKETTKSKEFSKDREFAVILEKIYSEIKVIGEDLLPLKTRVEFMFEEQGRQKEEIFIIKSDVRFIKGDIIKINDKLARIEACLAKVEGNLAHHLETSHT